MKLKRVAAAGLCGVMILNFAGCDQNNDKAKKQIDEVMDNYTSALKNFDGESLLELTNWEDDSEDYEAVETVMDLDAISKEKGSAYADCIKTIASRIKVDYDIDDLSIDGKEASLKVTYKTIDWESVYYDYTYLVFDDVIENAKNEKLTASVKGKITFVLDGKDWKISSVTKLNELWGFATAMPNVVNDADPLPDPTETDPTTTTTVETEPTTTTADNETYKKAIYSYINFLGGHEEGIRHAEKIYSKSFCGIYDINGDGVPELLFIEANDLEDEYSSASLYVCYYNWHAGEAIEAVKIDDIVYMAEGSHFIIYVTPESLLIGRGYGETANHYYDTEIYDSELNYYASYRCVSQYMYDPETDSENYSYAYYTGFMGNYSECDSNFYHLMLEYYVAQAYVVLASDFSPAQGEVEYPLNNLPQSGFVSYDELVKYLNTQL